jgi:hypothetical protein
MALFDPGAADPSAPFLAPFLTLCSISAERHFNFRSLIIVTPPTFVYNYARSDRIKWASFLSEREREREKEASHAISMGACGKTSRHLLESLRKRRLTEA